MNNLFFTLWIVHIVLESFPISSSGHLQLLNQARTYIRRQPALVLSPLVNYLMHIPTACVIIALLLKHRSALLSTSLISLIVAVCITDAITGGIYFMKQKIGRMHPVAERTALGIGFLISGLCMLTLLWAPQGSNTEISPMQAVIIGIAQSCALLPGISRLAITCTAALWLGIDPLLAILFSLSAELGLIGASLVKVFYGAKETETRTKLQSFFALTFWQWIILSFTTLISYFCLEFVIWTLQENHFWLFGIYPLFLALCLFLISKSTMNTL